MGMYTRLTVGMKLKKETPGEVIDVLNFLVNAIPLSAIPLNHPLFLCDRWRQIGQSGSYYFVTQGSKFFVDDTIKQWHLNIDISMKNYDDEIRKFIDWIHPWCDSTGCLGFYQYEEDEYPTLIFCDETGKAFRFVPTTQP